MSALVGAKCKVSRGFKALVGVVSAVAMMGATFTAPAAVAAPALVGGQNPCVLFYQNQKGKRFDVVQVEILGAQQGVVDVMILGLPKRVNASINGIDVNRQKSRSEQIVCGKEAVGSFSSYDLNSLNIDAGFFQIYADGFTVGKSLQLR